jgi:hypothetical protein
LHTLFYIMNLDFENEIEELRELKNTGTVIETDQYAQTRITSLQESIRCFLIEKYGPPPYIVEMTLHFPESMRDNGCDNIQDLETITIELGSIEHVPYSVYYFLENMVNRFTGGVFHRNAPHVLQARLNKGNEVPPMAFQEYSPQCSHQKYTLGFAGRPSTAGHFYISTRDNSRNHGPGSQGSKTEADCYIGKIIGGINDIAIVERIQTQPGVSRKNGMIDDSSHHIKIVSINVSKPESKLK